MASSISLFHLSFFDFLVRFHVEHPCKASGLLEFFDGSFKEFRYNFNDERSMCGIVAVLVHVAVHDGRCHPAVGQYEVNPAFLSVLIGVASGSTWLSVALVLIVADVGPPIFFDEGHGSGKSFKAAVEVAHYQLGAVVHCFKLQLYDGKYIIGS